jgi:hypothetical protein
MLMKPPEKWKIDWSAQRCAFRPDSCEFAACRPATCGAPLVHLTAHYLRCAHVMVNVHVTGGIPGLPMVAIPVCPMYRAGQPMHPTVAAVGATVLLLLRRSLARRGFSAAAAPAGSSGAPPRSPAPVKRLAVFCASALPTCTCALVGNGGFDWIVMMLLFRYTPPPHLRLHPPPPPPRPPYPPPTSTPTPSVGSTDHGASTLTRLTSTTSMPTPHHHYPPPPPRKEGDLPTVHDLVCWCHAVVHVIPAGGRWLCVGALCSPEWAGHHLRVRGPWCGAGAVWVRAGVRWGQHWPDGHSGTGGACPRGCCSGRHAGGE